MTVAFQSDKKYGQDRFDSYELWTRFVTQLLILRGVSLVKFKQTLKPVVGGRDPLNKHFQPVVGGRDPPKQTLSNRRRGTGPPPFLFIVV